MYDVPPLSFCGCVKCICDRKLEDRAGELHYWIRKDKFCEFPFCWVSPGLAVATKLSACPCTGRVKEGEP